MHLLRIAVCEDNKEDMDQLIRMIHMSLSAQSRPFDISRFQTGKALLSKYRPGQFDVLFIDMFLGDTLGIQIARQIRESGDQSHLVFVTQSPDFALEGYAVQAAHYLIKPVSAADIEAVWRRCLTLTAQDEEYITLMIDRRPRDIFLQDILYIEADNKRCLIHTTVDTLSTRVPIDQLEYMLAAPSFCRCHRGYLVNFDRVSNIGGDFLMCNGDKVYIRQNDLQYIRNLYRNYLSTRQSLSENTDSVSSKRE